jgi:two-component system chemotaxis response regulator CheB
MPKRDIVVIGASTGGVEALSGLVAGLPANLQASVFVVLHLSPYAESQLPQILSRAGALEARMAQDGEEIACSRILIAPPDRHLLLTQERVRVVDGPRENHFRPAIDPLFRSAALAFGPRVIGVMLTGALDDGASGLVAIKRMGGLALVQDPSTAAVPSMPHAGMTYVAVDACLSVAALASKLAALTQTEAPMPDMPQDTTDLEREVKIAGLDLSVIDHDQEQGTLVAITCPECHGPLWEMEDDGPLRYRSRVGHAYTAAAMETGLARVTEDALWTALNTLEESAKLFGRLAAHPSTTGNRRRERRFRELAQQAQARADRVRRLLGYVAAVDGGEDSSAEESPEPAV